MDIAFITKYLPMYEKAAILTVKIGFIGIAFAILVGLFCAIVQYQRIPIVRQLVMLHGGEIHVESEEGSGTTFIVELPLHQG